MNDPSHSINQVGGCYRLFVGLLAFVFLFVIAVVVFAPRDHASTARMHKANADVNGGFKTTLEMFKADCGRYPTTEEGLKALIIRPANIRAGDWRGPYFDPAQIPVDPWDRDYVYRCPGIHNPNGFDLFSYGPDGVSKTGGNDRDDIGNWEKPQYKPFPAGAFLEIAAGLSFLAIPFLYLIRLVVAALSPRFQVVVEQNRLADRIWFVMALIVLAIWLIALLLPKI